MSSHNFHVITGASGAGKSTLIAALRELGHVTFEEAALAVLREQQALNEGRGSDVLPSRDRAAFMEAVLARNIRNHEAAASIGGPVFFDRGVPETLAWLALSGVALQARHLAAQDRHRYAPTVFVAEPWPEIYVRDAERQHTFEQAARSFGATVQAYVRAGYATCVLPKVPVRERVAFVLERLKLR